MCNERVIAMVQFHLVGRLVGWLAGRFSCLTLLTCAVNEFLIQLVEKTREIFLFTAHQDILIVSADYNLTIIKCKNGDFFVKSEQSYKFFKIFRKSVVENSISEKKEIFSRHIRIIFFNL